MSRPLRVGFVVSEARPWVTTGGLGDVAGALPAALEAEAGHPVAVFAPLSREARPRAVAAGAAPTGVGLRLPGGRPARWWRAPRPGGGVDFLLDCPALFDRVGLYGPAGESAYGGAGWPDNPQRFAALCAAAWRAAPALLGGPVDLWHAHDWHAGALPGLRPAAPVVVTVHNLAHQGPFDPALGPALGFATPEVRAAYRLGRRGSLLRGALALADRVTTVSPGYAAEICTPALGCGLGGLLAARGVTGVLNGLDPSWDPARDPALPAPFSADARGGRAVCRRALLGALRLPDEPGDLLIGVVARLTAQKGVDLLPRLGPLLGAERLRLVILGDGEPELSRALAAFATAHRHRVALRTGFDDALARQIFAGADLALVPSRFEPCGLTQLQAMAYGAVPVVHGTGGLADTVRDLDAGPGATGFVYRPAEGLADALRRAAAVARRSPATFAALQQAGMRAPRGWAGPARAWAAIYAEVLMAAGPPR